VPKKIPNAGQDSREKKDKYKSRKGEAEESLGKDKGKKLERF